MQFHCFYLSHVQNSFNVIIVVGLVDIRMFSTDVKSLKISMHCACTFEQVLWVHNSLCEQKKNAKCIALCNFSYLVWKGYHHEILNCFVFLQHAFLIVSTNTESILSFLYCVVFGLPDVKR